MKFFKKSLFVIAIIASLNGFASDIDSDFEMIDTSTNVIVEKSDTATKGIDWQFELANKTLDWAYVKLLQDGQAVLSDRNQPEDMLADHDDYFLLQNGETVRLAGLDNNKEIELIVLTPNEISNLVHPEQEFGRSPRVIFANAKKQGRLKKAKIGKGKTLYFVLSDQFKLEPASKTLFKRTTDSGLPLDNNIK